MEDLVDQRQELLLLHAGLLDHGLQGGKVGLQLLLDVLVHASLHLPVLQALLVGLDLLHLRAQDAVLQVHLGQGVGDLDGRVKLQNCT